jgi:hypothetical protein
MGFRLQRRSLLAGALLGVACYSPTLPLPPPAEPEVSAVTGATGQYRLVGRVEAHADVVALNRRTEKITGQLTGADGRYDFIVEGQEGDQMELWYIAGKDPSPRVLFLLPSPDSGTSGAGGAPQ